jgi:hypothetical protein
MTKDNPTLAPATRVAIDIAKYRHEVLIEAPGRARRRRLTVLSTKADYDRLVEALMAYGSPVLIGFEATGDYHRGLAYRLLSAGFELRLVSSVARARTREALHNGWDKNDPKDAQVILHMLRIGATQRYVDPLAAGINDLQELSNTHAAISKAKTETWHRILTHYLPLYFPEIARFAGNSRSDWFFALLERFPTPGSIAALERESFIQAAWPLVGSLVSKARLLNDVSRQPAAPRLCRWQKALRPSLCSAWFWPRRAASSARASRSKSSLMPCWSTMMTISCFAKSPASDRSMP